MHNLISLLTGKPKQGATVYLTVSPKAQEAAYQALLDDGGHQAAAVAINPSTGAILAMASVPDVRPEPAHHARRPEVRQDRQPAARGSGPAAAQPGHQRQTYPPGSSFKVITSSAAFSTGKVANQTLHDPGARSRSCCPTATCCNNDGDETCGDGHPPVIEAFWLSCNTAFAKIGIKLGGTTLQPVRHQVRLEQPEPDDPDAGLAEQCPQRSPTRRSPG